MSINVDGHTLDIDEDGFLSQIDSWSENVATVLAKRLNIRLSDAHWEIITLIRDNFKETQSALFVREMVKLVKDTLGKEKGNSQYLYNLFPQGPALQANIIAGLPKPTC